MSSLALAHLTREAAAGGEDAWRALVGLLDPMLHSIARGYRLCDADADDVVQITWGRALLHLDRLDDPGAVAGWLAVTARRVAMRTLQRGVRELPAAEPPEPDPDHAVPAPDAVTIERERTAQLRAALGRRSGRQREQLTLLVDRPELSYEEVSSTLDMPVGSIGPTRERAFARLRTDTALACAVAA
jgi:RNA polymerase sigma factor (sigma-70 family)